MALFDYLYFWPFQRQFKKSYDCIWLLNDDAIVEDIGSAVAALEKEFDENPKTGVVGMKIVSLENPDFIYHGGTTRAYPTGLHKFGHVSKGELNVRTKERWVAGGSFAISAASFLISSA